MKTTHALVVASLVICQARAVRGEDAQRVDLVHQLEQRNARIEEKYDAEARASRERMTSEAELLSAGETRRRAQDEATARDHDAEVARARRGARRKTGIWLGAFGVGTLALGGASFVSATSMQSAVDAGGFATGADIESAATQIRVKQGIAYGAAGIGAVLALTGLALVW